MATYTSAGHATQIDFWMIWRRDQKLVRNTKVIPYGSIVPLHRLLVMDIILYALCQTMKPVTGPEQIKWWKKEQRDNLAAVLAELAVNPEKTLEAMWNEAVA